jgi:response regulator of citrate/malate metabolism
VKTILTELYALPPCACRLLARKRRGRRALTSREIAYISGLDRATVDRLSGKMDWDGVEVHTAIKFALACGVNHLSRRRHMEILKKGDFTHVRATKGRQKDYLVWLISRTALAMH